MTIALLWNLFVIMPSASAAASFNIIDHYVKESECNKVRNVIINMNSYLKAECVLAETVVVK